MTTIQKIITTAISLVFIFSAIIVAEIALTSVSAHATGYTAWVKNASGKYFYGTGRSKDGAKGKALGRCGRTCTVLSIKNGCRSLKLSNGETRRPKCR